MRSMSLKSRTLSNDQQGLVSIIVTMIILGIMVLIATSFTVIMNRERRQALDRQLSSQAFYAAESGVHDTIARLDSINGDITKCEDTPGKASGDNVLDAANQVEYTCVLVDKSPSELLIDPLGVDDSVVIRIETELPNINSILISWQDSSRDDGVTGSEFIPTSNTTHLLPQDGVSDADTAALTSNDGTGMIRATFMPLPTTLTRDNLIDAARTFFLYPREGVPSGTGSELINNGNRFIDGECNTNHPYRSFYPHYCNARFSPGPSGPLGGPTGVVYLRLQAIYKPVSVTIKAFDVDWETLELKNAQAVIDSTGKANDVLRRIQVRVPLESDFYYPDYAIESMDSICKRTAFPIGNGMSRNVELPNQGSDPSELDYNRALDQLVCNPQAP